MTKGIVYLVWGNNKQVLNELYRSNYSAHKFGYQTCVIKDKNTILKRERFDIVKNIEMDYNGFRNRIYLYEHSPFDINCYLDTDTTVRGDLDFGFEQAEKYGIACCIAPASSSYYADDNQPIKKDIPKDLPQYNCGVLFYSKELDNSPVNVFRNYACLLDRYEQSAKNDQPYFAYSLYKFGVNPYVLPKTWNFRPHIKYESEVYFGNLKILHKK